MWENEKYDIVNGLLTMRAVNNRLQDDFMQDKVFDAYAKFTTNSKRRQIYNNNHLKNRLPSFR